MKVTTKHFVLNVVRSLVMGLGLIFLPIFSYGTDISNWNDFSSAYAGGVADNNLTLLIEITFATSLNNNPAWSTLNIVGGQSIVGAIELDGNANGGFYLNGNKSLTLSDLITFKNFTRNSGGVIYMENGAKINAVDSEIKFNANSAALGGVFYLTSRSSISFVRAALRVNSNSVSTGNFGGAVAYIEDRSEINLYDTGAIFNENSSTLSAGVLFLNSTSKVNFEITTLIFSSNSAVDRGGALVVDDYSQINFVSSIITFIGNSVNYSAGAFYILKKGQINFISSLVDFVSNSSNFSGGSIEILDEGKLNFRASIVNFTSNSGGVYSGVARVYNEGEISFDNSSITFNGNKSNYYSGAIYASDKGRIIFSSSVISFSSNSAGWDGGSAMVERQGDIRFDYSTVVFIANTSGKNGAVLDNFNRGTISFNNSSASFISNSASYGAVVYVINGGTINFANSIVNFKSNNAVWDGGVLYVSVDSKIKISNSVINLNANIAGAGGAIYIENGGQINVIDSTVIFNANIASNNGGGAFIINGSSLNFINTKVSFINNTATNKGGAMYMYDSKILLSEIEFIGNRANGVPNDIHLAGDSNIEFNPNLKQRVIMAGGITSENGSNNIQKTGLGVLELRDEAKIELDGKLTIEGGLLELKDIRNQVRAGELTISTNGSLSISVDFTNKLVSSLYGDIINIWNNSTLLVNRIGDVPVIGSSIAFIYANNPTVPNGFNNIDGGNQGYSFIWNGSANNWIGYLIYMQSSVQIKPSFYANLRTIGANVEALEDINRVYLGYEQDKKAKRIWVSFSVSGLNYNGNNLIENFSMQSNGIKMGIGIVKGGGIFAGYKEIIAKQGLDKANAQDIEAGIYKDLTINKVKFNSMLSFSMQNIDVKDAKAFDTKSIRFALEGSAPIFKFIDIFSGLKAAYVMSDEIDIKNINVNFKPAKYTNAEVSVGLKKDFNISRKIAMSGKAYWGIIAMGKEPSFDSSIGEIKASAKGETFIGLSGAIKYSMTSNLDLFVGVNGDKSDISNRYYGNVGISYKFSKGNDSSTVSKEEIAEDAKEDIKEDIKEDVLMQEIIKNEYKIIETVHKIFELPVIYFNTNSKEVKKQYEKKIRDIAEELKSMNLQKVIVEGHTDSVGNYKVNKKLSIARAKAVYDELVRLGIPAQKIEYRGYAYLKPVASNKTAKGRQLNRRGEVSIIADFVREKKVLANEKEELPDANLTDMSSDDKNRVESSKERRKNAFRQFVLSAALFEINSAQLSKEAETNIADISRELKKMSFSKLTIEGHTDDTGRMSYNKPLSEKRAKAVYREFIKNGIPAEKMKYIGFAYFLPALPNDSAESRRLNRRVEIFIEK
jgi:predicted outer membrane repeat protein